MSDHPVSTTVQFVFGDDSTVTVGLPALLKALGFSLDVKEIRMCVTQDNRSLIAQASPKETDYPSITVDAVDDQGRTVYLSNAELPNSDNPEAITARLYAGHACYETDAPIAFVRHKVADEDFIQANIKKAEAGKNVTKIVYVDTETAQYRPWNGNDDMPEHAED